MFTHDSRIVPKFDMSNVTNTSNMFYTCRALVSVPEFNLINVINATNMFYLYWSGTFNTINLTQSSINNIVASCANAINVTNKNFTNIGIINTTLRGYIQNAPRYSAAVANGWVL